MTWHTPVGDRTLFGAEAELVRAILDVMLDRLFDNNDFGDDPLWDYNGPLFDSLSPPQQLTVLRRVAEHLLTETSQTLELSAVNEAALYAMFQTLALQITAEVDAELAGVPSSDPRFWRRSTLQAFKQSFAQENDHCSDSFGTGDRPNESSTNLEQWHLLTETLKDQYLWERDMQWAEDEFEVEPGNVTVMKHFWGIDHDSYADFTEDAAQKLEEILEDSLHGISPRKPR